MRNAWCEEEAKACVVHYGKQGIDEALALRVYSTRLLGRNPALVLHGGGNTSVKSTATDIFGEPVDVLCVKGSGWDMAQIEPQGLPAVRLAPLQALEQLDALDDESMVSYQRANLLDQSSPNPSVETLLHAFLPHTYIDHAHASAILALSDQPDGEAICADVFGEDMAIIPYVMPGFGLAKLAATTWRKTPGVKGLILHKHGIFTFGETARQAYDNMIDMVSRAEKHIERTPAKSLTKAALPKNPATFAQVAPRLRGALSRQNGKGDWQRWVLSFRTNEAVRAWVDQDNLEKQAWRGVVTPDHIIRIKKQPLILPPARADDLAGYGKAAEKRIKEWEAAYRQYFETNDKMLDGTRQMLDPLPRAILLPGLGIVGVGASKKAADIAADLIENNLATVRMAERLGRFEPLPDADLFAMEYWSLEQAKLGRGKALPLARQVAVITGGAGAIGLATAQAMARNGAEVALLDLDEESVTAAASSISPQALGLVCDVTDKASIEAAFARIVRHFGGVDIVVSNAGAAFTGAIDTLDEATLRRSFELNFFAHQRIAQEASAVMVAQGTGGVLLFNASKQAINPGADFGAYGLPKAATLFLSRQYALELGRHGIRANAVNADRIRSGLLDETMVSERAKARGLSETDYMSGNLLGVEVTADDVAQAFVHQAMALKTTASVTTVDGGNMAAILR